VSFGVSAATGAEVEYERLFKEADEALYAAKAAGRNCVVPEPAPVVQPVAEPALVPAG
jgi:PleD family two-component response regulator